MRVKELLESGIMELEQSGVVEAATDARLLLENCLGKSRTEIFLLAESTVDAGRQDQFRQYIHRRQKREPVGYILGQCEFWSLPFYVTPDVLIPRPETEFLIERTLSLAKRSNFSSGKILDLCSGSGVIAIVLVKETGKRVVGIDISAYALLVARLNSRRHDVLSEIDFIQADLFSCLLQNQKFSLIVSNPPYVSRFDLNNNLEPEVACFEPHLALDGGERGLDLILKIRSILPSMLKPGGEIFIEIGADQGQEVRRLFEKSVRGLPDFSLVEILIDYTGRDRVLHGMLAE
jgi:release factor glutamine methyltransferase